MAYGRRRRRRWTPSPATPSDYTPYTPPARPDWSPASLPPRGFQAHREGEVMRRFETWDEMIAHAETVTPDGCPVARRESINYMGDVSWDLGVKWQGALDLAKTGWPEGAKKAQEYTDALFAKVAASMPVPEQQWDTEGLGWDIGKVMNNEPEHWFHYQDGRDIQDGPRFIRVVVNVAASAGIDSRTLLARGSVVAALVELLEFAGHRVELQVVECTAGGWGQRQSFLMGTTVKTFLAPLHMPLVAYAVSHPSVLRRLVFAVKENCPEWEALGVPNGYGAPAEVPTDMQGDVYCPKMHLQDGVPWEDPKAAVRWIIHELGKQGVKLGIED